MFRFASISSIAFLVLAQWSLVAGGLALCRRRGAPRGPRHRLIELSAPALLTGALGILALLPGQEMGPWRGWLLVAILPVLGGWGRLALTSPTVIGDGAARQRDSDRIWRVATVLLHLAVFACACAWLCHWFVIHLKVELGRWPATTLWLTLTVVVNRVIGAWMLGVLALGSLILCGSPGEVEDPEDSIRLERLGQSLVWLAVWRLAAMSVSLALGMAADPIGPGFFVHFVMLIGGGSLLGVRVLIGTLLPSLYGWLAIQQARAGRSQAAAQQFLPALIMTIIGEILGAGLTFGTLGLGF